MKNELKLQQKITQIAEAKSETSYQKIPLDKKMELVLQEGKLKKKENCVI